MIYFDKFVRASYLFRFFTGVEKVFDYGKILFDYEEMVGNYDDVMPVRGLDTNESDARAGS